MVGAPSDENPPEEPDAPVEPDEPEDPEELVAPEPGPDDPAHPQVLHGVVEGDVGVAGPKAQNGFGLAGIEIPEARGHLDRGGVHGLKADLGCEAMGP